MPPHLWNNDISGIGPLSLAIKEARPREAFVRLLETTLADASNIPREVFVHESGPESLSKTYGLTGPHGTNLAMVDAFRIIFVLGGSYRAIREVDDRNQDRVVRAGEFYWIRPNDWNLVRNDSARTVLSIVFAKNETWYVWYHRKRESAPKAPGRRGRDARSDVHTATRYHTHAEATPELRHAVALMNAAVTNGSSPCCPATVKAMARTLLGWCLRELRVDEELEAAANAAGTLVPGKRAFGEICAYITEHLQEDLSREHVAGMFFMSEDHLTRLFRLHTKMGFVEFVRTERFRRAERLLETSRLSVKEVAVACGFNLSAYFIKRFREKHGVTPIKWRRLNAGTTDSGTH